MPKKAKELTALEVSRLTTQGKHNTGSGLYLEIKGNSKAWVYRVTVGHKRRNIGVGAYPSVSLAQARKQTHEINTLIAKGIDPVEQKKATKSAIKAAQAKEVTFKKCAIAYLDAHSKSWKNQRHIQNWLRSLEMYAFPYVGDLLIRDIEQSNILAILNPIWTEKTETAKRVRNRIEAVLDYAAVSGYRSSDNPARWKGRLDKILPSPSKVNKVKHHEAMSIDEVPAFIESLSGRGGLSAKCLLFLILTATRSGEVRGARWSEIDLDNKLWTIPAERMKAGAAHEVPLSDQAITLLSTLPRIKGCDYVFPSAKGGMLSDMALSMLMRKMDIEAVPHGFRSTFRDWAGDKTNYPRDIAEAALAHTLSNKVEAAYRRSTALEKRRKMMNDWSRFVFSKMADSQNVIRLKRG